MATRPALVSVDWVLFAALALMGGVLLRYEVTGMLGDGIAFLGTAATMIVTWIGARVDLRGRRDTGGR